MKMKSLVLLLITALLAGCIYYRPYDGSAPPRPRPDSQPYGGGYNTLDSSYFYDYLGPYGFWTRYTPYGYVWVPRNVGYGWRPYSRGHWVWTDFGWNWVSTERWGWLVFHYGRWGWDMRMGWYWVPDTLWGPAWVSWRYGDLYIGWAPLPPGIDLRPGYGYGRRNNIRIPGEHWNFVRVHNFLDRTLDRWVMPLERNVTIVNMTVINTDIQIQGNRAVNRGLGLEQVQRVANRTVDRYELKDARRAEEGRIEGREVIVFRPEIKKNELARPRNSVDSNEVTNRLEKNELRSPDRPGTVDDEAKLREVHKQETSLLRQSQDEEISMIRRRAEKDKAELADPEEKKAVDSRLKSSIEKIEKKHAEEKARLSKRQKEEEEKASTVRIKKKKD